MVHTSWNRSGMYLLNESFNTGKYLLASLTVYWCLKALLCSRYTVGQCEIYHASQLKVEYLTFMDLEGASDSRIPLHSFNSSAFP